MPHPSISFGIQKYYQNEPRSGGFYSRNNFILNKRWDIPNKS